MPGVQSGTAPLASDDSTRERAGTTRLSAPLACVVLSAGLASGASAQELPPPVDPSLVNLGEFPSENLPTLPPRMPATLYWIRPVADAVTDPFCAPRAAGGLHEGVDFASPLNTPVRAPADGVVRFVGNAGPRNGLVIVLDHARFDDQPVESQYLHLSSTNVVVGALAQAGDIIGTTGNSGVNDRGQPYRPHLHWMVRIANEPIDGLALLDNRPRAVPVVREGREPVRRLRRYPRVIEPRLQRTFLRTGPNSTPSAAPEPSPAPRHEQGSTEAASNEAGAAPRQSETVRAYRDGGFDGREGDPCKKVEGVVCPSGSSSRYDILTCRWTCVPDG